MDDVLVVSDNMASMNRAKLLLNLFCRGSGFKVNWNKCKFKCFGDENVSLEGVES